MTHIARAGTMTRPCAYTCFEGSFSRNFVISRFYFGFLAFASRFITATAIAQPSAAVTHRSKSCNMGKLVPPPPQVLPNTPDCVIHKLLSTLVPDAHALHPSDEV